MSGCKRDPIWNYFLDVKGSATNKKAKCKHCETVIQAIVYRMKIHKNKCVGNVGESKPQEVTHSEESDEENIGFAEVREREKITAAQQFNRIQ